MTTKRNLLFLPVTLMCIVFASCTVDINHKTPDKIPPGTSFTATAQTVARGTSAEAVTLTYEYIKASTGASTPNLTASVASSGSDLWTANIVPPSGGSFQAWDKVVLNWAVAFHSWGQSQSHSTSVTLAVDPVLSLIISPESVIAGDSVTGAGGDATGIVSISGARQLATIVALEVVDPQPLDARVTLDPGAVVIPANSTTQTFTLHSRLHRHSGTISVLPGHPYDPQACTVKAKITDMPTIQATKTYHVNNP